MPETGGYNEDTERVVHGKRIRDHRARGYTSIMGRSSVYVDCPFCGRRVLAYVWSLAGSGKRCPGCPAIHGGRGTTRVKADA